MDHDQPLPTELSEQEKEARNLLAAQRAWADFAKENPIAARKAKQRAEELRRRNYVVNLHFGNKLSLNGRG